MCELHCITSHHGGQGNQHKANNIRSTFSMKPHQIIGLPPTRLSGLGALRDKRRAQLRLLADLPTIRSAP